MFTLSCFRRKRLLQGRSLSTAMVGIVSASAFLAANPLANEDFAIEKDTSELKTKWYKKMTKTLVVMTYPTPNFG